MIQTEHPLETTELSLAAPHASPWIRSWRWDSFWMLSGFWLPGLFLLLPLAQAQLLLIPVILSLWIAHRFASFYLASCVVEYQSVLKTHSRYFLALPAVLLILVGCFLLAPESWLPLPRLWRVLLLASLDYFFSLYHFSVQHYGVLAVYRSRLPHGQRDPGLLRWDWWLCLSVSGLLAIVLDLAYGEFDPLRNLGIETLASPPSLLLIKSGLCLALLLYWLNSMRLYLSRQQGLARSLYLSSLCFMTAISLFVNPILYFAIIQIQHWLVSLGLTTHMARNSNPLVTSDSGKGSQWYRSWNWVNARAWGPLLVLVAISLSLAPILEADYFIAHDFDQAVLTGQTFLLRFKDSIWIYIFATAAFFSAYVHYIYDRGVFHFSDPLTRQAALPLLRQKP